MIDNSFTGSSFMQIEIRSKSQKPDQLLNCKRVRDEIFQELNPCYLKKNFLNSDFFCKLYRFYFRSGLYEKIL